MTVTLSTLAISTTIRSTIQRVHAQVEQAYTEATTGRYADVGMTLGNRTGSALSFRLEGSATERQLASNKLVDSRLGAIDNVLDTVAASASDLNKALILGFTDPKVLQSTVQTAASAMQTLTGMLNTSLNGQTLFAGQNTDQKPMNAYVEGSAPRSDVVQSFDDYLASISTTADQLTDAQMTAYLDGPFKALFQTASDGTWQPFSNASSDNVVSRLSESQSVESTVSANEEAFRDLTAGYAMVMDLATRNLSVKAMGVVTAAAQQKLSTGMAGITAIQADIGLRQNRITDANTTLTQKKDIMELSLDSLEGVDQSEAALRMQQLETQLQVSYKAAGQILQLSILDYI
ncbi:flagellar hook-associated family protein [Aurantimonas sp. Leaf443]|uniref:flagellar hook-associated family protein n=1 Tax=Aurantimonas sp. Leaf443 TaxID=1736378 RepID=UPI0006F80EAE|nr:flagellar hook-associated family protein [Aurantimonas sp. Leaf443]KQT82447.1 hypothetical protein ASG48_15345 [Aurantimonas sp. Leaf443]